MFEFIKQETTDKEQQSLPHITEHCTENKGISQCHKPCWIHLVIGRKTIHFDVHFKWFKQFRVLQFGRWLLVDAWLQMFVLFTVNNAENAAVVFDIILERMGIFLCHPST